MKRIFISSLLSLVCTVLLAQGSYKITFDQNDFKYASFDGVLSVTTSKPDANYGSDDCAPALPYFPYRILRPSGIIEEDYNIDIKKELIYKGLDIQANPTILSTDIAMDSCVIKKASKSLDSPILYAKNQYHYGYNYFFFKITPFVYDKTDKELYFISEITITFAGNGKEVPSKDCTVRKKEHIRNLVLNPDEMDNYYPASLENSKAPLSKSMSSLPTINNGTIDYVIITIDSLKPYFDELLEWKIRKGLRAKIVTTDEINTQITDSGLNLQQKIKTWLFQRYYQNDLKWVLLGGDSCAVPIQYCQAKWNEGGNIHSESVPADIFYSAGNLNFWDDNGNGTVGEYYGDYVNFEPYFYLTRIPVQNAQDINYYTQKLLNYEMAKANFHESYVNRMLFTGTIVDDTITRYNNLCALFSGWSGSKDFLFRDTLNSHTFTNLLSNNTLTSNNLDTLLSSSYHFYHMDCHGMSKYWLLPDNEKFWFNNAFSLRNDDKTIVLTTACHSNAFNQEFCLSRSFMNSTKGALAFFGSSGSGLFKSDINDFSLSIAYDGYFFKNLFDGTPSDGSYHYGAVAAAAKEHFLSEASSNETDGYRYLMFAINPLGDPEMPIYTTSPSSFNTISPIIKGDTVTVSTGVDGCTIAVTSVDKGETYFDVAENTSSHTFLNVASPFYVTVTKHNYKPHSSTTHFYTKIIGDSHIWGSKVYKINNLLDDYTVEWSLTNKTSTPGVTLVQNSPSQNQCTVTCPNSYFKGVLIARIKKGYALKAIDSLAISTAGDFQFADATSPLSYLGNESDVTAFPYDPLTLVSTDFTNATFSFSGTIPFDWTNNNDGTITLEYLPPLNSPAISTVTGVNTTTQKAFRFYVNVGVLHPFPLNASINVVPTGSIYTISVSSDDSEGIEEWMLTIINAETGLVVHKQMVKGNMAQVDTSGWRSGVYIIQGTAGNETITQKISIK